MKTIYHEGKRYYVTPEGNHYPSVTSVISATSDMSWKEKWIKRVGEEEANRVSKQATTRGNSIHEMAEHYLKGTLDDEWMHEPNAKTFMNITPHLDKIEPILIEEALYSDRICIAGRVDCIGLYEGMPCVIDFKTSRRPRGAQSDVVRKYFIQCAMYAMMHYDMTKQVLQDSVIIMAVDEETSCFFREKVSKWVKPALDVIHRYYEIQSGSPQPVT